MMMEKNVDSQLWHACAGGMVQMPRVNSKVFYFPQGHAEHTSATVDFMSLPRIPPLILCRVAALKFLADPDTDEVHARIRLVPIGNNQACYEIEDADNGLESSVEKPVSFAKTLTQSDANNGGGFSVPRYCAETIFPRLDYTADPPVQTVVAKDVHGETWKFRHIYRGTPRRHLLTTGWSAFVNQKKLVAGDSVVFLRAENGDLCVGIRRAKRGRIGSPEAPSGWNSSSASYGKFSVFLREDDKNSGGNGGRGRLRPESVIEAVKLAASGQPFEVLYYPRANTPEFFVKASTVNSSTRVPWCAGMRFKMPFETEDACRISWFMGTISSVQFADPVLWPNSPWRLLQVTWDEPDLLQNVKRVSPWLIELVSHMPVIHLSPFLPPKKKSRLPQQTSDFSYDDQIPMPSFSGNPLGPSSSNITAGIQGARHAQLGVPFLPELHLSNKLHFRFLSPVFHGSSDPLAKTPDHGHNKEVSNDVSCLLTMGSPHDKRLENTENTRAPRFLLFGQPILTEQQMSKKCSGESVSSSCAISLKTERSALQNQGFHGIELGLDNTTGHCKVFLESEDVGRTLDLSVLGSYDELYKRLGNMFGLERSEMESLVFYRDASGVLKRIGDEEFSVFVKTAKRLTISTGSGANSSIGRKWMTELPTGGRGLESSNTTGPLSIFA